MVHQVLLRRGPRLMGRLAGRQRPVAHKATKTKTHIRGLCSAEANPDPG